MDKRKRSRKWIKWPVVALVLLAVCDPRLMVSHYEVDAENVQFPIRLALVTDLHSCWYGKGQGRLLRALEKEQPDAVLLVGDIFDDVQGNENARLFLEGAAEQYPCYYVTGNHEYWSEDEKLQQMMDILSACGIPNLSGKSEVLSVRGESITLLGVDDPDNRQGLSVETQLSLMQHEKTPGQYTVLLSHRPSLFDVYCSYGFDLVLSGHAHGGQWRIPGLIDGLFAPDEGFLPDYAGGRYEREGTCMIVSRGLARESTLLPRIFNRPELVMVEIR